MPQHKVQPGDTLSAIAQSHQVTPSAIRAQNPQIADADHIEVGWTLAIPANDSDAAATLPKPRSPDSRASCEPTASACTDEYAEIIHVMGAGDDQWCLALPEAAATEILREIEEMDGLMSEFKQAQDAPVNPQSDEPGPKRKWMIKAAEQGVIEPEPEPDSQQEPAKASAIQSRIAALNEQIAWYEDYDPGYFFSFISEDDEKREHILTAAKEKRLAMLRSEVASLRARLDEGAASQGVKGTGIKARDFSRRSHGAEAGIIEIMVFSRPGRWYYLRRQVYRRILASYASIRYIRKSRSIASALQNKSATAAELIGKIREDLAGDAAKSPIGSIEVKFAGASEDLFLLGEEHSKLSWNSSEGESPVENSLQVSAEAQLMRFAMQASAGVNSFDLSTGEVDIGTKASASMALAEAEATLAEVFVPNEAGWDCRFTYRNRDGQLSDLTFGAFRLAGDITLNCFAGGRASGDANARLSTGAATFLLSDRKKIKPHPKAGLAVSGNAFAGAEAGGSVGGKFCWLHPDEQFKSNANWQELLKIEAGGTFAAGIGAGMDFELGYAGRKVIFVCKGRLVFGPGASGSFGSTLSAEVAWNLLTSMFDVLHASDFQYLKNINADLFYHWSRAIYLDLLSELGDLGELLVDQFDFYRVWGLRGDRKSQAIQLAQRIKRDARDAGSIEQVAYRGIPYWKLPPETIGMMLHTLTEEFLESDEDDQETAIIIVLSCINSWRHFYEVLEHMSVDGHRVEAMSSLRRICEILDNHGGSRQLEQFHSWIISSLSNSPVLTDFDLAWSKSGRGSNAGIS